MKYLIAIIAILWVGSAFAGSPGYIAGPFVAVCNPNAPTQCLAPDVNGALPITGGGGGGGSSTITGPLGPQQTAAQSLATTYNAPSYVLFNNVSATGAGPAMNPSGGDYFLNINGTFGGTSLAIAYTVNGVTTTTTYTAVPTTPIALAIGAGTTVQATLTGGTPSGVTASLNGVGPGAFAGTTSNSGPVAVAIAQTLVTLTAGTSSQLIGANASRKSLRWMVTGVNPMTVVPGATAAVANAGMNYSGNAGTGQQGGSDSFEGSSIATGAFQAISTLGTTVTVWEGQ